MVHSVLILYLFRVCSWGFVRFSMNLTALLVLLYEYVLLGRIWFVF